MAKKKRRLSQAEKERKRIENYIKKKEKQGFEWTEEFKQKMKSLQKATDLKFWTWRRLAQQAKAISPITGKKVSGIEQMTAKRKLAGKKAWEKRKESAKKDYTDYGWNGEYDSYNDWYDVPLYEEIIFDRIMAMMDEFGNVGERALYNLIISEIKAHGKSAVISNIANAPDDALAQAQQMVFYESKESAMRAYDKLAEIIRGTIPTKEEAVADGEITDMMNTTDDLEE